MEELSLMTLKSDGKFKEKLTCSFKHDIENLVCFHPTTQKSESFTSIDYFWPKYKIQRSYLSWQEQWYNIWINLDLVVWRIGWTFIKALKSLEICTFMGFFCPKRNVSARKFQRNVVSWHWKVMQNLKENWLIAWKMT